MGLTPSTPESRVYTYSCFAVNRRNRAQREESTLDGVSHLAIARANDKTKEQPAILHPHSLLKNTSAQIV